MSRTSTCPGCKDGARTSSTYASETALVVEPTTARHGPIPSWVMLASKVVFLPRFQGTEP